MTCTGVMIDWDSDLDHTELTRFLPDAVSSVNLNLCIYKLSLVFINFIIIDNAHFIKHVLNISHSVLVLVESLSFSHFWFLFIHCLDIGIRLIFFFNIDLTS